jgi:phytoene dehydrogenase-like protein
MLSRHLLLFLCSLAYQLLLSSSFSSSSHSRRLHATGFHAAAAAAASSSEDDKAYDLVVIGGGIGGMATAITVAKQQQQQSHTKKILLIESEPSVGGRVRSDVTDDGYILDRGFAVFIEAYPQSQEMLDYDALRLNQFLPGARVKLPNREKLAAVSDPLRRRRDIMKAITSPVGSFRDKANLLPLFFTVITKDIQTLFDENNEEIDTLTCLRDKYNFSEEFISSFFAPFLEGIYLTPLSKQSSKMFYFVMKMFTVGSASLPMGGMQSVSDQLGQRCLDLGVDMKLNSRVLSIQQQSQQQQQQQSTSATAKESMFSVVVEGRGQDEQQHLNAKSVVVATDFNVARKLLQDIPGLESLKSLPKLSQRSVGCIYYAFPSPAPLEEPILILNGEGYERRNTKEFPVNNICFPSIVQKSYAPNGYELCCVSLLEGAITGHDGNQGALDMAVRKQLSVWFPASAGDIIDESKWVTKGFYLISNAQPAQFDEEGCANVHGGRDCSTFQGLTMPDGLFVAGDHMATATFNGALESGVNAGDAVNSCFFVSENYSLTLLRCNNSWV